MVTPPLAHVCLRRAATVTAQGVSRAPLPVRNGRIATSASTRAFHVDLRDHLVCPGLVNAHEHLHLNAVPPLPGAAPFANSYAWIEAFQPHFARADVVAALAVPKALRLRHGALKNLLAGTTCVAHHDPWHPALDAADFPVTLLHDAGWSYALGWPSYGPDVRKSFAATLPGRPWMIHLAEGVDATAQRELQALDRLGCLAPHCVLVHGVGLGERDIDRVLAVGAAVVWCPASNLALLGATMHPRRLYDAGRLALGTDSRLSGSRDLLEEWRTALALGELDATELLALATTRSADILRMPQQGRLAPGSPADMVIVEDRGGVPACSLVGLSRSEIRAVIRHGVPRIADPDFAEWFAVAGVDTVHVSLDGRPKLLDRRLADPALMALEPGLALRVARRAGEGRGMREARCP